MLINASKTVALMIAGMVLVKENKTITKMYDRMKNKIRQKYEDWFPEDLNTETREHCEV